MPQEMSIQPLLRKSLRAMLVNVTLAASAPFFWGVVKSLTAQSKKTLADVGRSARGPEALQWCLTGAGMPLLPLLRQALRNVGVSNLMSSAIAAFVVALSALSLSAATQTELALYMFVRAAHGAVTALVLPSLPTTLSRMRYWDVLFMIASCGQVFYASVFEPHTLLPSYRAFLTRASRLSSRQLECIADLYRGGSWSPSVTKFLAKEVGCVGLPNEPQQYCKIMHRSHSCTGHLLRSTWKIFSFALFLYFPTKVLTTAIFMTREKWRKPFKTLKAVLKSTLLSALFITTSSSAPLVALCLFSRWGKRSAAGVAALSALLAGAAVVIEPPSRRLEITLYSLMQAMRSLILCAIRFRVLPTPKRFQISMLLVVSLTSLLLQFEKAPETLPSNFRRGVKFLTAS